jgi:hypothetical protein
MSRWMALFAYCILTAAITWVFDLMNFGVPSDSLQSYIAKVLGCAGGLVIHWAGSK